MTNVFEKNKEDLPQDRKKSKEETSSPVIHVMPQLNKGKNKSKLIAKKIGFVIIAISSIALVLFVIFAYSYLFKNKAQKDKQVDNLIEEIDDLELKVPDKIVKKIPKKEEIEVVKEEPSSEPDEAYEDIVQLADIATTSATSTELTDEINATSTDDIATTSEETVATTSEEEVIYEFIDSDNDGLSDKEEIILGTDKNSIDSDDDGFNDLEEVLTLNNPAGEGTVDKNENMTKYLNGVLNYYLFYPSVWSHSDLEEDGSVIFRTIDNQAIQIISPPNIDNFNIEEWYATEVSAKKIKQRQIVNKDNWSGLKSEDGLNVYIVHPDLPNRVFVLFYTPGVKNILDYKNIFEMMVNSFDIGSASPETATTSPEQVATSSEVIATTSLESEN